MTSYKRQWKIPSSSDKSKTYTVSLTMSDQYICHCWPFLRTRKECTHIILAKSGAYEDAMLPSEEARADALLRQYAEEGYRYITWFPESMYSWDKRNFEIIKKNPNYADVKTFMSQGRKIVIVKEKPEAYQAAIANFARIIEGIDLRKVKDKERIKKELRQTFFDLQQHVVYNKTGVVNPNLPEGSVYNSGTYGKQLHKLAMQHKWLR